MASRSNQSNLREGELPVKLAIAARMIASPVVALSTAANKQRNPSVPSALNHRYELIAMPPLQGGGIAKSLRSASSTTAQRGIYDKRKLARERRAFSWQTIEFS
jgi:hypothetical protein